MKKPKGPKLTANERYLLLIIANLRGSVYDLWGKLNAIKEGKETIRQAVTKLELKNCIEEMGGRLHADHTGAHGAHLPHPNDKTLSEELKHALIERHRRATKRGRIVENVMDLVAPNEK